MKSVVEFMGDPGVPVAERYESAAMEHLGPHQRRLWLALWEVIDKEIGREGTDTDE